MRAVRGIPGCYAALHDTPGGAMATYTSRTVTHTRYEWIVPAEAPHGATQAEMTKANAAAHQKFEDVKGRKAEYDHDITFHPSDDGIVIAFTHETDAPR